MGRYELRIGAYDTSSADYLTTVTNFEGLEFNRNHTARSDWSTNVPYNQDYDTWVLERVFIIDTQGSTLDERVLFAGLLETVEHQKTSSGTTKISGRGLLTECEYESTSTTYEATFIHNAIADFATNLQFGHSMSTPSYYSQIENKNTDTADVANMDANELLGRTSDGGVGCDYTAYTYDFSDEQFENDVTSSSGDVAHLDQIDSYSLSHGVKLGGSTTGTHSITVTVEKFNHDIETAWEVPLRLASDTQPDDIRIYQDGTRIRSWAPGYSISHEWFEPITGSTFASDDSISSIDEFTAPKITIEIDTSSPSQYLDIDVLAMTDEDYEHSLPTSLNDNGVYDGPEMFPPQTLVQFSQYGTKSDTDQRIAYQVKDGQFEYDNRGFTEFKTYGQTLSLDKRTNWVQFLDEGTSNKTQNTHRIYLQRDPVPPENRSGRYLMPAVYHHALVPFDDDGISFYPSKTFTGTKIEIFQEMHELSSWRFLANYADAANTSITSFVSGENQPIPDGIRIIDESRKQDYSNYANKVTVVGADDVEATTKSTPEINQLGRTIHRTYRNPNLDSQSAVKSKADALVRSLIQNRKEAGSMTVTPTRLDVGYDYQFPLFNDVFTDGNSLGDGVAIFDSRQTDYAESVGFDIEIDTNDMIFELILWVDLTELGDDEYYHLASAQHGHDFIRVYGDGSLSIVHPTDAGHESETRTDSGLISSKTSHRLTLLNEYDWGDDTYTGKGWIDGGDFSTTDFTFSATADSYIGKLWLGSSWPQRRIHESELEAHWEADAENVDSSSIYDTWNGNNLTNNGAQDADGRWRGSILFNGDDSVTHPDTSFGNVSTDNGFTWSAWLNPDTGINYTLVSNGGASIGDNGYELISNSSGDFEFHVNGDNGATSITATDAAHDINDGDWHHVACEYEGGRLAIYVDGDERASVSTNSLEPITQDSAEWCVGNTDGFTDGGPYDGRIDDIRWYAPSSITPTQVSDLATLSVGTNSFVGGLDDVRIWDLNPTKDYDYDGVTSIQEILNNPYVEATTSGRLGHLREIESISGQGLTTYWRFNEYASVGGDEYDILDGGPEGFDHPVKLNGVDINLQVASVEEATYNLASDGGSLELKFNIDDRLDVQLNATKRSLRDAQDSI